MHGQHSEKKFETCIENRLTTIGGYQKGDRDTYDPQRSIFPRDIISFIKSTQPNEWEYLFNIQKEGLRNAIDYLLSASIPDMKMSFCPSVSRFERRFGGVFTGERNELRH